MRGRDSDGSTDCVYHDMESFLKELKAVFH